MLDGYDGVVYDLDGTLVRLDVDWDAVRDDVAAVYRDAGVDPGDTDLWGLLQGATDHGFASDAHAEVARHEREGARRSRRLPHADALARVDRPVGVCTLNCEAAARIALDVHDLAGDVDFVVGYDTVAEQKPHPEPLLATVDGLGFDPERVVFVGDSQRDADTAEAAGTEFAWADAVRLD